jgi:hypothetical protein
MFQKAIKHEAKLRLAIAGPAGSGKTYTALTIAQSLANGGKIAVVDTEHGSASKYADLFSFDVDEMDPPYHPDRFVDAIREAAEAGYSVIVLDSLSHAWNGTGGLLEIVDQIAARSSSKNTFVAWKQGTPIYNKLVDRIIQSNIHVIATIRQKMDYVLENENGKQKPVKVGLAPVQREGFEYEFDVVMNMDNDNQGVIVKTRCPALSGGVYRKPGKDVANILAAWLTGAPVPEPVKPELKPRPEAPAAQQEQAPHVKLPVGGAPILTPQMIVNEGLAENVANAAKIVNALGVAGKSADIGLPKVKTYRLWRETGLDSKDAAAKTIAGEFPQSQPA